MGMWRDHRTRPGGQNILEEAASTGKGTTCFLPFTPVMSELVARLLVSVEEHELLVPLASPRERCLCPLRPSLELCPPFPRPPFPPGMLGLKLPSASRVPAR